MGVGTSSNVKSCEPCYWVQGATDACKDKCDEEAAKAHKLCEGMKDGPEKAKCRQVVEEQRGDCYRECNRKK